MPAQDGEFIQTCPTARQANALRTLITPTYIGTGGPLPVRDSPMSPCLETPRLHLNPFALSDADELFQCITPAVARFMTWDPPSAEDFPSICERTARAQDRGGMQFVIRRRDSNACLGLCGVERLDDELPELGIWMKTAAHGQGYGREAVAALLAWASRASGCSAFSYPVAVENIASRRIAEGLGGKIVATRTGRKYNSVVYQIPALRA